MDELSLLARIASLNTRLDSLDPWLYVSSIAVVVGILFEFAIIRHEYKDDRADWRRGIIRPPDRPSRKWLIVDIVGVGLVCLGLAGEFTVEVKAGEIAAQLRTANGQLIAVLDGKASALDNSTQALKTRADEAEAELARLTGPIQSVPVINGVATPDPTKGLRLRVLLHTDVRIKLPTLSKGKAVTWTLFIVQDEKGSHQFSTFPKNVMFGNFLNAPPHSFCNMELVTDEYGTTDTTFGAASCPTNESDPIRK
jgi:hypothetical protein